MANQQDFACCNDNHEVFSCYEFNCQHTVKPECISNVFLSHVDGQNWHMIASIVTIHKMFCIWLSVLWALTIVHYIFKICSKIWRLIQESMDVCLTLSTHNGMIWCSSEINLFPIINRAPLALAYLQHLQNDNSKFTYLWLHQPIGGILENKRYIRVCSFLFNFRLKMPIIFFCIEWCRN